MIFTNENKLLIIVFLNLKEKLEKKTGIVHISDNLKKQRGMQFLFLDQKMTFLPDIFLIRKKYLKIKRSFKTLNSTKNLKYVILRDQKNKNDDTDILTNNYYLFKRLLIATHIKIKI